MRAFFCLVPLVVLAGTAMGQGSSRSIPGKPSCDELLAFGATPSTIEDAKKSFFGKPLADYSPDELIAIRDKKCSGRTEDERNSLQQASLRAAIVLNIRLESLRREIEQLKQEKRAKAEQDKRKGRVAANRSGDQEALAFANDFFTRRVTRCGERVFIAENLGFTYASNGWEYIYELREPAVTVQSKSVSEIDRLNGIEWQGQIVLNAKATRHVKRGTRNDVWTTWSQWSDPRDRFRGGLQKHNGGWEVFYAQPFRQDVAPTLGSIMCQDVPGGLR